MADVDSLELSARLSRLRLSLRISKPPLYPDCENEQALALSGPSTIQVLSDTDSGFGSPAQLNSPPPSPAPPTPEDDDLHPLLKPQLMESPGAKNVHLLPVCSSAAASRIAHPCSSTGSSRRAHPPLFTVNSHDCSSTCSMVRLNIPNPPKPPTSPPPAPRYLSSSLAPIPPTIKTGIIRGGVRA